MTPDELASIQFGQRVLFTRTLHRRHGEESRTVRGRSLRVWTRKWVPEVYPGQTAPEPREGIVIGVRTLVDGTVDYGYEEPTVFNREHSFSALLVAFNLHRKPVLVLAEHAWLLDAAQAESEPPGFMTIWGVCSKHGRGDCPCLTAPSPLEGIRS